MYVSLVCCCVVFVRVRPCLIACGGMLPAAFPTDAAAAPVSGQRLGSGTGASAGIPAPPGMPAHRELQRRTSPVAPVPGSAAARPAQQPRPMSRREKADLAAMQRLFRQAAAAGRASASIAVNHARRDTQSVRPKPPVIPPLRLSEEERARHDEGRNAAAGSAPAPSFGPAKGRDVKRRSRSVTRGHTKPSKAGKKRKSSQRRQRP